MAIHDVVIWHNPRCTKSRGTLELLRERGIEPVIIDYQQTPPSSEDIENVLAMLRLQPRELMRRDEDDYARLNLDDPALSRVQLVAAMIAHPILIQRPIVIATGRAAIGRPPENVLGIL